jgi:SAM-dependent methyltransferase
MGSSTPGGQKPSVLFPVAIFLGAFLLFQIQPILGRYVLPRFGGGPSVWTTCMLFFQLLLVVGYAYAHAAGSLRSTRTQVFIHGGALLLSLLFLPIARHAGGWGIADANEGGNDPSMRILLLLAMAIGGPYMMLSATGPLMQRWFSPSYPQKSPWRLYALSNAGSLLALITYPFLVEPYLRLPTQTLLWSALYLVFLAVSIGAGLLLRPVVSESKSPVAADPSPRPAAADVLLWFGFAAVGSTLLLSTTNQLSERIAATPFLWVAPLSIYLVTFILTFESDRWYRRSPFAVASGALAAFACITLLGQVNSLSLREQLGAWLATLFVLCMTCHGELARSRPATRYLTAYYLSIAGGGALGGVFVAIIAPRVFASFTEYPIALAAACCLVFANWLRTGAFALWTSRNLSIRIPLAALLIGTLTSGMAIWTESRQPVLARVRNFYGILRVSDSLTDRGWIRILDHGPIRHGFQYLRSPERSWPTSYYGPHTGIGTVLSAIAGPRRVAVIGLGTGTLAAWGRPPGDARSDTFRFYEINPAVEQVARTWFSFLKDSKARVEVVPGDARVQLEKELSQGHSRDFDVIAVDAFSGDAIPLHLLTAESGEIYKRHLAPGGCLLLHISNRALDLEPVTRGLANSIGWPAFLFASGPYEDTGESSSHWVLITANRELLKQPAVAGRVSSWERLPPIAWTDDFVSLWHVVRF